jgi:hypothetical protein
MSINQVVNFSSEGSDERPETMNKTLVALEGLMEKLLVAQQEQGTILKSLLDRLGADPDSDQEQGSPSNNAFGLFVPRPSPTPIPIRPTPTPGPTPSPTPTTGQQGPGNQNVPGGGLQPPPEIPAIPELPEIPGGGGGAGGGGPHHRVGDGEQEQEED